MTPFEEAMYEVLEGSRYDFLMGRRVDIRERLARVLERFLDWVYDTFDFELPQNIRYETNLIFGIFAAISVICLLAVGFAVFRTVRNSRRKRRYDLRDIFDEIKEKNYTISDLYKLSDAAQNTREFVRYRYIAAIVALDNREIIEIHPSYTNAVILQQIRKSEKPHLARDFNVIAETFHYTWFGHKDIGGDIADAFKAAVTEVVENA